MAFIKRKVKPNLIASEHMLDFSNASELISFAQKNNVNIDPLDVSRLTQLLNISMRLKPLKGDESGSLELDKHGNWIMTINSLHHPNRQRFTIAHEIAHYIKHTPLMSIFTDTVFFRNDQSNRMETEANQFAAELLMPEDKFNNYVENISTKVSDIADHFQVSSMAVRIRAKQLGFKGHNL